MIFVNFYSKWNGSIKNAIWDVNNKKWYNWHKFESRFLFNNTYGLPVLTKDSKCPNQVFCLIGRSTTICGKQVLETWISLNNDNRICLLNMRYSWTKSSFWDVNNKKWRKYCKYVSPVLFNNTACVHNGHQMSISSILRLNGRSTD
jgi:hypothetical protein